MLLLDSKNIDCVQTHESFQLPLYMWYWEYMEIIIICTPPNTQAIWSQAEIDLNIQTYAQLSSRKDRHPAKGNLKKLTWF